jgi:heme exporter protein D
MWNDFFSAGGMGMYPVTIFGFLLVVSCALYTLRLRPHHARLAKILAGTTLMAGLLGTATGVCNSAFYIHKVEVSKQLEIFTLGLQESLHDTILALIFVIIASLIASAGVLRDARVKAA